MEQETAGMNEILSRIEKVEQENRKLMDWAASNASLLLGSQRGDAQKEDERKWLLEENQIKAAYALNLCTVSVSQIVDYQDLYILEQEYEGILNNLNLENIPHDDELLSVLKRILDTITFFRIQEGDKQRIEKRYQNKMKSAIWSAVPNLSVILATGNPVALAVSLVSQVGIGYMNYRKEKEKINDERDEEMWKLQRSAIEQFNALRRELFETAWKLASKYHFPDEYRLTERQISQYNQILMDRDPLRRYERLAFVKDQFKAYPNFHYYLGDAANDVAQDSQGRYTSAIRDKYKVLAKECFQTYQAINNSSLLRTDPICAACNLAYADLLDPETDEALILDCLDRAVASAGNSLDIIQLCAVGYLRMKKFPKAEKYLRMLSVEGYNTSANAQLLSRLYLHDYMRDDNSPEKLNEIRSDHDSLSLIAPDVHLFNLPTPGCKPDVTAIERSFISAQVDSYSKATAYIIDAIINRTAAIFNREYLNPFPDREHPLEYYVSKEWEASLDNALRLNSVKTAYLKALGTKDKLINGIARSLNDLDSSFKDFPFWDNVSVKDANAALNNARSVLESMQQKIWDQSYDAVRSEELVSLKIRENYLNLYRKSFLDTAGAYLQYIVRPDNVDYLSEFSSYELKLHAVCAKNGLTYPEGEDFLLKPVSGFKPDRIGKNLTDPLIDAMRNRVREWYENLDDTEKKEVQVLFQDDPRFSKKIEEIRKIGSPVIFGNNEVLAVIVSEKEDVSYYLLTDKILSKKKKKVETEMYKSFKDYTDYQDCKLPLIGFGEGGIYKHIGNLLVTLNKLQ